MTYNSFSPSDTIKIAYDLAKNFKGSEIILLNGELGAGKTTFAKGIAKALDISDTIVSPTFTIMNEYSGRLKLYHYDMYRIIERDDLIELGIEEYLYLGGVAVIEWNKFNLDNLKVINVNLEYVEDGIRRITIE